MKKVFCLVMLTLIFLFLAAFQIGFGGIEDCTMTHFELERN